MIDNVALSGWGVTSAYAPDFPALINGLVEGRLIGSQPWFATESEWQDLRLSCNPHYVPEAQPFGSAFSRLQPVIDQALAKAGLGQEHLQGKRVRVYLVGHGQRADIADYLGYQDRNDQEELLFFPKIKRLHASNFDQDRLVKQLTQTYQLSWPAVSLYCASNSALAAVHLAQSSIAAGEVDLVLVIGWLETQTQDIIFLGGQDMLGEGSSQPFSNHNSSILPTNGVVALILESGQHAQQRGFKPSAILRSSMFCQSSGGRGSSSFTADFRTIAQTLERVLVDADLSPQDIACVFPHANGVIASDKAEAMALQKLWGKAGIPVVSYKGQIGYMVSCCGLLDLMLIADALQQRRLLALTSRYPIDETLQIHVHADSPPLALEKEHIIKSGIGLDGSAIAMVISANWEGANE
ncbi:beta-ketoacyl synthase N-terminal-like domain-containing protein [Serratia sp. DD3]|uniref:beta-ketoacyl synthase N-terminal-like domain-containing protein n=1 Tax=Serratia sp. DD3 TaxID=1410619 RepID=UPI0003C510D7|nr:beta-ketoacyl synthase N-terminal-like domain-containing protein [Serratia sp. DD3]KEY57370.1 erythronolide synthase, modules 3 and 4 [Serratia sp. DD3]